MIRYVDLGDQILEGCHKFAWWDTVIERFLTFWGSQDWETLEEFEIDLLHQGGKDDITCKKYDPHGFERLFPKKGKKK